MDQIERLFSNGSVADLILGVLGLEAVALLLYRRATGRGLAMVDLAALMLPGAALVMALRAALNGAHWHEIAAWLLAAFVAHLFDLARRLTR